MDKPTQEQIKEALDWVECGILTQHPVPKSYAKLDKEARILAAALREARSDLLEADRAAIRAPLIEALKEMRHTILDSNSAYTDSFWLLKKINSALASVKEE